MERRTVCSRVPNRVPLVLLALGLSCLSLAQSYPAYVPHRVLVGYRSGATSTQLHASFLSVGATVHKQIAHTRSVVLDLPKGASEQTTLKALAKRPEIAWAELDRIVPPSFTPNDTYYVGAYHLQKLQMPAVWDLTFGSPSVTIAILDTGCEATHPDLASRYVPGWNVYDNNSNTADVYGHGTSVAGVAAAVGNNGIGVAGIAWGCNIMPIRISDLSGNATYSAMASGLSWAADHGARVANISYIASDSSTVSSAAQYFQSKGGVVTSSAGNYSTFDSSADNPYVLTVSATDANDNLAVWSNTGNNVDVSAPGAGIYTTDRNASYTSFSGTSAAAPCVAAVAALVISTNPNLTAQQVQQVIEQSADDLGPAGWDPSFGAGRVNCWKAVNLASTFTVSAPPPPPTSPTVSFASPGTGSTVSGSVPVNVNATDTSGVSTVSLYVDGALSSTSTTTPYAFVVNSAGLANGAHTFSAKATDVLGNSSTAQVQVTVSNAAVVDTTPPTVSITSPSSGYAIRNSLAVSASASDNVGVTRVELWVNGALSSTSTSSPYSFSLGTRKWSSGTYSLVCKAYDAAGNVGSSATVTVKK